MDLLKAMQAYVSVVENGSMVGAAASLDTSNAAVSRQLAALEAHLGARLLNRTTRRVSMTAAGQEFLVRAEQILTDVAEAEAIAGESAASPAGVLRVSAPLSFGLSRLPSWLPGFMERYPGIRPDIDLSDRVVDLANEGIDVAVRIARQPAATNLIARRIASVPTRICAAPGYLARRGRPEAPEDLAGHDTLAFSYLASGDTWGFQDAQGREASVRVRPSAHANNGDLLCELALSGLGIIVQPAFIVDRHIAAGTLVPLLPGWEMESFTLYAVYLSRRFLSAKVRVFIDYLAEMEGAAPPGRAAG